MGKRVAAIASVAAVVAMCVFICWMSAQPADDSTEMSMGIVRRIVALIVPGYDQLPTVDQLYWQAALEPVVRKIAHFLEYAVLGALMLNAAWRVAREFGREAFSLRGLVGLSWALSTAYAATDEIHQMFVSGRTGMITDVLLDSVGVIAGVTIVALALSRHNDSE